MGWGIKHIDKRKVVSHAGFWLSWVVSFTVLQSIGQGSDSFFMWLKYYLVTLPIFVAHTYLLAWWLIPETFYKNRFVRLAAGVAVLLVVFSVIELIVSNELVFKPFGHEMAFAPGYLNLKNIVISGIGNHYIILVFFAIKVGKAWYTAQSRKMEEQNRNLQTELEIYQYQLQPRIMLHLMEVLGFAMKEKLPKSPELIIQISNFLNAFLSKKNESRMPLASETELMKMFLDIYSKALGSRLNSEFKTDGNLNLFVFPSFLFLPLMDFFIKTGLKCNDSFDYNVFMKGENRKLFFYMDLWSEKEFSLTDDFDVQMMKKRLHYSFPGKFSLKEERDENFRMLQVEVFPEIV